jgi:hypothetical protein
MSLQLNGDTGVTFNDSSLQGAAASPYVLKNRIINGDMRIDQRNAGASVSANGAYFVDRWQLGKSGGTIAASQSTTVPSNYKNSSLISVTTGYSIAASDQNNIRQFIEGFNVDGLGWGTASASTVTLSFWVRSSMTGTFAGSLMNSAYDRSYVFNYTISAANTWEQKSVTIAGDTSGTWLTDNSTGIRLFFDLGSGSNYDATAGAWGAGEKRRTSGAVQLFGTTGATFYVTGVQLEVGSTATPFERRLYGTELANCQRYYYKWVPATTNDYAYNGLSLSTTAIYGTFKLPITMRTSPTLTTSGTATDYGGYQGSGQFTCSAIPTINASNIDVLLMNYTFSSGLTVGSASIMGSRTINGYLGFNAEL